MMFKSEFPVDVDLLSCLIERFPRVSPRFLAAAMYPYPLMPWFDPLQQRLVIDIFVRHGLLPKAAENAGSIEKQWQRENSQMRKTWQQMREEAREKEDIGMGAADAERRAVWLGDRQSLQCGYQLKLDPTTKRFPSSPLQFVDTEGNAVVGVHRGPSRSLLVQGAGAGGSGLEFVSLSYHEEIISQMALVHSAGLDLCVIGPRGCGKSTLVARFAEVVGLGLQYFPLYKDMTSLDLFQKRTTLANGDTVWMSSPLTLACRSGGVVVLDGLDQVPATTLAVLQSLIRDRFAVLPDGSRFVSGEAFEGLLQGKRLALGLDLKVFENHSAQALSEEDLHARGVFRIHKDLRIVGLARPGSSATAQGSWLSPEITAAFLPFITLRTLRRDEEDTLMRSELVMKGAGEGWSDLHVGGTKGKGIDEAEFSKSVEKLLSLAHNLRGRKDDESRSIAGSLSTRQLVRICRRMRMEPGAQLASLVKNSCLWRFMPKLAQTTLHSALLEAGIDQVKEVKEETSVEDSSGKIKVEKFDAQPSSDAIAHADNKGWKLRSDRAVVGRVWLGKVGVNVRECVDELLVPQTLFYDNKRQTLLLQAMAMDYHLGEHLLLIGNQGVGKNKLADRFLQLLNLPRQYIQLDRDTTVAQLTSLPVVVDGIVTYEDSALVQAAAHGHTLVIDEADKAPTHVTAILKSLLADGEMLLADGRRLVMGIEANPSQQSSPHSRNGGRNTNGFSNPISGGSGSALARSGAANGVIAVHPDFRVIVLANRPGFPFMGNDFFREIGDIFACYVVENPDEESELELLQNYAKDVPLETLRKLSVAFQELRKLVDDNVIRYPYSTRELVNIVRHMQKFPDDGIAVILQNVFDFDQYSNEEKEIISNLFHRHGIPIALSANYKLTLGNITPLPEPTLTEKWTKMPRTGANASANSPLDYAVLDIPWRAHPDGSNFFPMQPPQRNQSLRRQESRAINFGEEVFTFNVSQCCG